MINYTNYIIDCVMHAHACIVIFHKTYRLILTTKNKKYSKVHIGIGCKVCHESHVEKVSHSCLEWRPA